MVLTSSVAIADMKRFSPVLPITSPWQKRTALGCMRRLDSALEMDRCGFKKANLTNGRRGTNL